MLLSSDEKVILRKLGIKALILFGSRAQNAARDNSDYDFLVIGKKSEDAYDFLYNTLSSKIKKLVNIDIVFDQDAPMELKNHVIKYGIVLYQENKNNFVKFKELIMTKYQDFAPYRRMFQTATLDRID